MSTNARIAIAELALYALVAYGSYQMSKTPDQRRSDRLKAYMRTYQACSMFAYAFGRAAIKAELAYMREVNT